MPLQDYVVYLPERWAIQEVSSTQTANFIEKRAAGTLPVNSFWWYKQVGSNPISSTTGGSRQYNAPQNGLVHAVQGGSMTGPDGVRSVPYLEDLHRLAESRLRAKVNETSLEGGLILAEFGKTSDFVKSAMVQTAKALRAARRGNVKGVWNALTGGKPLVDAVSDGWLAFTYAFMPTARDVHTAMHLLEKGLVIDPTRRVRSTRTLNVNATSRKESPSGSVTSKTCEGLIRYGGGIRYRVDHPVLATLDALGFANPATLAWELLPFSFVVDWFVPVGEFIHQLTPPRGISFVDGYTYVKVDGTCSWSADYKTQPDPPGWRVKCSTEELLRDRRKLTAFPTPGLVIPNLSLSKANVASGLALLQQALR